MRRFLSVAITLFVTLAGAPVAGAQETARPGHVTGVFRLDADPEITATGAADIEQGRAITADTVFHVASLSKQITAAALAMAILDGHVRLDDPVSAYIPETAKYGDGLTVAHLVYMTSGLTEYYEVPRPGGLPWTTFVYFTVDDAIEASLSVETLQFEPGTEWRYSNINYMLITRIVESVYGKRFSEVVEERIFGPLGMEASLVNDDITALVPNRANAYAPRSEAVLEDLRGNSGIDVKDGDGFVLIRRNAPHYGGSGVMTSMADWGKWQQDMLSHEILGEEFWELMMRTRKFSHDKDNDAFGLVHAMRNGNAMVWYEGGDIDASSYMAAFPGKGIGVACFANMPGGGCRDRVRAILDGLVAAGEL